MNEGRIFFTDSELNSPVESQSPATPSPEAESSTESEVLRRSAATVPPIPIPGARPRSQTAPERAFVAVGLRSPGSPPSESRGGFTQMMAEGYSRPPSRPLPVSEGRGRTTTNQPASEALFPAPAASERRDQRGSLVVSRPTENQDVTNRVLGEQNGNVRDANDADSELSTSVAQPWAAANSPTPARASRLPPPPGPPPNRPLPEIHGRGVLASLLNGRETFPSSQNGAHLPRGGSDSTAPGFKNAGYAMRARTGPRPDAPSSDTDGSDFRSSSKSMRHSDDVFGP